MGCYGIGINRIMASAIELCNDKDGITWPISIAPWEVMIVPAGATDDIIEAAEKIYEELKANGVEVLLDDRDVRGGVKFKDADLIGVPVRVTVGKKSLAEGKAEIKLRRDSESTKADIGVCAEEVLEIVNSLKAELHVGS
jgi:prolyl-tRNA synthetase